MILKSEDDVKFLRDICYGSKAFLCPAYIIQVKLREEKILLEAQSKFYLEITDNHFELIPEINHYQYFQNEKKLYVKMKSSQNY